MVFDSVIRTHHLVTSSSGYLRAPRFRGWAQQDAHELLRYLLDGLRSEELNRYKEAISDHLRIPRNVNPRSVEPDLVALAKVFLLQICSSFARTKLQGNGMNEAVSSRGKALVVVNI